MPPSSWSTTCSKCSASSFGHEVVRGLQCCARVSDPAQPPTAGLPTSPGISRSGRPFGRWMMDWTSIASASRSLAAINRIAYSIPIRAKTTSDWQQSFKLQSKRSITMRTGLRTLSCPGYQQAIDSNPTIVVDNGYAYARRSF